MLYAMPAALTVIMLFLSGFPAHAVGDGERIPRHKCNKALVREIFEKENSELMDAIHKHFVEKQTHGRTDGQFCAWLRQRHNGETEARFDADCVRCNEPEPVVEEVERSVPRDVRRRIREVAQPAPQAYDDPPETQAPMRTQSAGGGGFGDFMSSPFMGGLLGGVVGGFFGGMLYNKFGQNNQQQSMFPQPQWPGQWGQPGMPPGVLPYQGMQPPGVLPYGPGGQFGQGPNGVLPYNSGVMPWQNTFGNPSMGGYGQYGGGYGGGYGQVAGYGRGPAPGVLPLAPQPAGYYPYSVMGSVQQQHWSLINAGR